MTQDSSFLKEVNDKNEIFGILNFLINKEKLNSNEPNNIEINFDNASNQIEAKINDDINNIVFKWSSLLFELILNKDEELSVSSIKISKEGNQKLLPDSWNNLLILDDSDFIGDISFLENEKLWVLFDKNTLNIEQHDEVTGTLLMDDDNEIKVVLICSDIANFGDKTQYSFFIQTGKDSTKDAFDKGDILNTNNLLDVLNKNTISYYILGE